MVGYAMSERAKDAGASLQNSRPVKVLVVPRAGAVRARIEAAAVAEARAPDVVHPAVAHLVPREYTPGALGWTVPVLIEEERNDRGQLTGRVAVIAEESFARGKPDFADALDRKPDDWDPGPQTVTPGTPQGGGRP